MVDWNEPEFAALAKKYDDATVIASLRIQRHIQRNGIPGIHFKRKSEERLEQVLPMVAHQKCAAEMRKQLKRTRRNP